MLFVSFVACMPVHLVPCDDLFSLLQARVDKTSRGRLESCDLFSDKARHENESKLRRIEHIEGVLAHDCGKQCVLSTLVDRERNRARVVAKRSVRLEENRRVWLWLDLLLCWRTNMGLFVTNELILLPNFFLELLKLLWLELGLALLWSRTFHLLFFWFFKQTRQLK